MTRKFRPTGRPAAAVLTATALSFSLAGCKIDDRPLLAWGRPAPPASYAGAPAPGPLDPTYAPPPPALAAYPPSVRAYAYPQRAYLMSRAVYDEPPSYAFGYGGEQPWAWDIADEGTMFAEPIGDGWRYYYYDPGEPYPYFVQEPDYGYAYGDGGVLIALFDAAGALLSGPQYAPIEYRARDYWRRGHDLDEAYGRSPRYRVDERVWRDRAPGVVQPQAHWFQTASAQPAWRQAAAVGAAQALARDRGRRPGWRGDQSRQIALAAPPTGRSQPLRPNWTPEPPEAWRGGARPAPPRPPVAQSQVTQSRAPGPPRGHAPPQILAHAPPQGPTAAPPRVAHAGPPQPAWREARQARAPWTPPARHFAPPPGAHEPQGRPSGERPSAFARMDRSPPHEPPRPGGGHPGGGHPGGGPAPAAMAPQAHGPPAAPPQPHPGGGPHAPAGGPHGNPGGGHGGGQHGHDRDHH